MTSTQTSTGQDDANTFDLVKLLLLVWRRKWLVAVVALLFGVAGWVYANKIATPLYTSTARMAFQVRFQQVVDVESVISGVSTDQEAINTEIEVIRSRSVIGRLVDELDLVNNTAFNGLAEPSPYSLGVIKSRIRDTILGPPEATDPIDAETVRLRTILLVRSKIQVRSIRNTFLFDISATTEDRETSEWLANNLARIYIEEQLRIKFDATQYAVNWLSDQVSDLERQLEEKEASIKNLRANTELVNAESLDALGVRAKDIRNRLEELEDIRTQAGTTRATIDQLIEARDIDRTLEAIDDPILNRLAPRARTGGAAAQQAFFDQLDTLRRDTDIEDRRAMVQIQTLQVSLEDLLQEISEQNTDLRALTQLVRERDATSVLYETFLARLKETSVQIGLQQPDSRILSEAVAGTPVAPRRARIQAMSLMMGLFLAVGALILRQILHDVFRTADELERLSGQTVLGQIPQMPIKKRSGLITYLQENPNSAAAEAVRNLRTSILLTDIDNPPQIIMSTSSVPGEGKTTIAIALSHNLSGLGKRVLLLEGDVRRRTLNDYFDLSTDAASLVAVLTDKSPLADAILKDPKMGFDVILGDTSHLNAADLFSSDRFARLLEELRGLYDYIVIDTPPVLVVPDARVIGQMADATIYSVRWDSTSKAQVRDGLLQLTSVGIDPSGVILSQIDAKGMKRYGYGDRYGAYASYGAKNYYTSG